MILFHLIISLYLLDVEVNYGNNKANRERAYDEFGITFEQLHGKGEAKDTMLNPSGRTAKVNGYFATKASWANMSLLGEFRWFSNPYKYKERVFTQPHKAVVASTPFQTIMKTGGPTAFYTRVKLFCNQHDVSFSLLTPGGRKSEPRKEGLRNTYLLALSIRLGISGMFSYVFYCSFIFIFLIFFV